MTMIRKKILILAKEKTKTKLKTAAMNFPDLEILESNSESEALKLIHIHPIALVILEETLEQFDPSKIGAILTSRQMLYPTSFLIICPHIRDDKLLSDFENLYIDHLTTPFSISQATAKIKLFLELFMKTNAVSQSIEELDKAYQKIILQHDNTLTRDAAVKTLATESSHTVNRIGESLRSLSGNIYTLLRKTGLTPDHRNRLAAIGNAAQAISLTTKKLASHIRHTKETSFERDCHILYVQGSDEYFNIFHHSVRSMINCKLTRADNMADGLASICNNQYDMIFIDHFQNDGSGFELLDRLNRIRNYVPVIFTLDKPHAHLGPEAIAKGAFSFALKEELAGNNAVSMIHSTLQKDALTREVKEARSRIFTISRRDSLTRLYNRQSFEKELGAEISKSLRYKTALSIMLLSFDDLESVRNNHGFDMVDQILSTSAAVTQSMVRSNDMVCRYGDIQFAVIMPHTDMAGARLLAKRIQRRLMEQTYPADTASLTVSVNTGAAAFDDQTDTSLSHLVTKALAALDSDEKSGNDLTDTPTKTVKR